MTESGGGAGSGMGVLVRADGSRNFFRAVASHAAADNVEFGVRTGGAFTPLGTRTTTWVDGDVLRIEVSGTSPNIIVKVFQNGSQLGADATGATGPDSGDPGIAYSSTSTSAVVDVWEGGDLGAAATAWGPLLALRNNRLVIPA